MDISLRSILTAGISTVTATTLVFAPSVQPPPPPERTVQLTAAVQPLAPQEAPPLYIADLAPPTARARGNARNAPTCPGSACHTHSAEPGQHDRQHLSRRRAVGAIRVRGRHRRAAVDSRMSAGFRSDHGVLHLRRRHRRQRRLQLHRLASRARRRHRERGRLRHRRRPGIRLAGNRRVEYIPAAAAALFPTPPRPPVQGPFSALDRTADGPDSAVAGATSS